MLNAPINIQAVLEQQILPWVIADGASKLIYTSNTWKGLHAQEIPEAISISPKKRRGKRVSCHGPRHYGNVSVRVAHWPEDNQDMLRYPTLACVVKGAADFHVADYVVHCPQRHFVLFRAGVPTPGNDTSRPHFEGACAGRYCEIIWISPRMSGADGLAVWACRSQNDRHWQSGVAGNGFVRHQALATVFNLFVQNVEEKKQRNQQLISTTLSLTLQLLVHNFKYNRIAADQVESPASQPQAFHIAERFIQENLTRPLTIDDVAQAVFMSRSTFTRQFRQATGQSFHQYISNLRLQQAKVLLREGRWAIKSIARMVGLQPAQLRALFQQELKMSPTTFRNQCLNNAADSSTAPK